MTVRRIPPSGGENEAAYVPLVLLKLGGSLITDKTRPETARDEVIERLAGEITRAAAALPGGLVLGHGSGSFGHVSAAEHGLTSGAATASSDLSRRLDGVSAVQAAAARLHRRVIEALLRSGAAPFSLAPSGLLLTRGGKPARLSVDTPLQALKAGLIPVLYGDVVLDFSQGAAIASTETVLGELARRLPRRGYRVTRAVWAGATEGVYGPDGELLPYLDESSVAALDEHLRGAAGTDVTGGIRHRVDSALELARHGIPSLILDGRVPGRLEEALRGDEVPGTRIGA